VVWDGVQELGEIQMPGGDGASAVEMENDDGLVPVQPRRFPSDGLHDPNRFFGRVAYVFAGQIDRPLAVTRMGYTDSMPSDPGVTPIMRFADFTISPLWSYRGDAEGATFANGGVQQCIVDARGVRRCTHMGWPAGWYPYNKPRYTPVSWNGSLLEDKLDKAGTLYRRNRQYDPSLGQFTQEDPIGLAGGLNLYGFAAGDPVNFSDPFGLCPLDAGGNGDSDDFDDCQALSSGWWANRIARGQGSTLFNTIMGTIRACSEDADCSAGINVFFALRMKVVGKVTSVNQMNSQVRRGQAPKSVIRVDKGKVKGEQDNVHFDDKSALNRDGTWKHGQRSLLKQNETGFGKADSRCLRLR